VQATITHTPIRHCSITATRWQPNQW
jgi:hypothetical protein